MPLTSGERLGPYEIVAPLGAGGMGEVYKARDTRLDRTVAIKILPPELAADAAFRERFDREARTISSLEHPAICSLYDVGTHGTAAYLVMRFVDGETLAQRIARGPLPLELALDIADRIAGALGAAHDRGVVHRDLKPGNVMIARDGTVQVLDFGLAKNVALMADAVSAGPTVAAATAGATILGTPAYMSPEQARGGDVDRRADVWAFGCVLYEMLAGRRAFAGPTPADTLAAVLTREPDWAAVPDTTPAGIRSIVARCLRKDAARRPRDIGDIRLALEDARINAVPDVHVGRGGSRAWAPWIAGAALFAATVVLAAALVARSRGGAAQARPIRLELVTAPSGDPESFALSPDGTAIAFVTTSEGVGRLAIRRFDQPSPRTVDNTEGATQPFWSPDGHAIAFFAERKLKRVDLAGGAPAVIADAPTPRGGAWNSDDTIMFAPSTPGGLMRVPARGGAASIVTRAAAPGALSHRWPEFLPGNRGLLFFGVLGALESRGIYLMRPDGSVPARIVDADSGARFVPPDNLLFIRGGNLVVVRFDPVSGVLRGDPSVLAGSVSSQVRGAFSAAANILAYRAGLVERRQLVWVTRAGVASPIGDIDSAAISSPELSPDARRAIVQRFVQGNVDLWMVDTIRGVPTRITFDPTVEAHAVWSPDGRRIVFSAVRNGRVGLYEKNIEDGGTERLLDAVGNQPMPCDWSPDGRFILYSAQDAAGENDLWVQPIDGGRAAIAVQTPFDDVNGQFSPDGRWIAYQSDVSGRSEIYIAPFRGGAPRAQVSPGGGTQPRWRRDGTELFYIAPDGRMMATPIAGGGEALDVGRPRALFSTRLAAGINIVPGRAQYAVASDGRFLLNADAGDAATPPITVVLNWFRASAD